MAEAYFDDDLAIVDDPPPPQQPHMVSSLKRKVDEDVPAAPDDSNLPPVSNGAASASATDTASTTTVTASKKKKVIDTIDLCESDDEDFVSTYGKQSWVAGTHRVGTSNEDADLNDGGLHTDDAQNVPDADGRVRINLLKPDSDPDVFLAQHLATIIKPHQIGGLRFMFDNIVEDFTKTKDGTKGCGCILAHSMGLGKTFQVISFTDIFLSNSFGKRVLIIVPINTLQNWQSEFEMWFPTQRKISDAFKPTTSKGDSGSDGDGSERSVPAQDARRNFKLWVVSSDLKTYLNRANQIVRWLTEGGVLLMGYEMFRLILQGRTTHLENGLSQDKIDKIKANVERALLDPGPDLIVCDEGHRIKNSKAGISQALKRIKTKRRLVLTGYPLQNNLKEYWCMVDFVRPSLLGDAQHFATMFENPIKQGQCRDSCESDKARMRRRIHVLTNLLRGTVQRRSHTILKSSLPKKHEHVLFIRMTEIQKNLMVALMAHLKEQKALGPLQLFAACIKICNHPDILYNCLDKTDLDLAAELEIDIKDTTKNKSVSNNVSGFSGFNASSELSPVAFGESSNSSHLEMPSTSRRTQNSDTRAVDFSFVASLMAHYEMGNLAHSNKTLLLFQLINKCVGEYGEKMLIFSQSLLTLDVLEGFLKEQPVPGADSGEIWTRGTNYFRLDGRTTATDRERFINQFNRDDRFKLFLLSTKAGSLGINLIGANRIVIFDSAFNPCHDSQAACRIYRYGQQRQCYIYRFVTDYTIEKKIYDHQLNKQSISNRIVEDVQTASLFNYCQISSYVENLDQDLEQALASKPDDADDDIQIDLGPSVQSDQLLYEMCLEYNWAMTKPPIEHESLLLDNLDVRLNAQEKQDAMREYEQTKQQMNGQFYRQPYSNGMYNYGQNGVSSSTSGLPPAQPFYNRLYPPQPNADSLLQNGEQVKQKLISQGFAYERSIDMPQNVILQEKSQNRQTSIIPQGSRVPIYFNSITRQRVFVTNDGKVVEVNTSILMPQRNGFNQAHNGLAPAAAGAVRPSNSGINPSAAASHPGAQIEVITLDD